MRKFLLFLALSVILGGIATEAFAQNAKHRMKLVFPLGESAVTGKVCKPEHQTNNGCCQPPKEIYTYAPGATGCCTSPNEVHGTAPDQRCCTPWQPADQPRWGQTAEYPCGGYCEAPNVKYSYSSYTACCPDCTAAGGVVAFQSTTDVCGTCCMNMPIDCGNAGEHVCEPGTGITYCSQKSACNDPTEWLIGGAGEGGYTCCPSCTGTRYEHTASSCGNCCTSPNEIVTYQTDTSCCPPLPVDHIRLSQTPTNICGDYITCGDGAIPNAEKNACVCDTDSGYTGTWQKDEGSGNGCAPVQCEAIMLAAGYNPTNFTVTGSTITYTGTMTITQDLDIGTCHLIVNSDSINALQVNSGITLKAKTITGVTAARTAHAIYNNGGTIIADTITGMGTVTDDRGAASGSGIYNNNGTIEASAITGEITAIVNSDRDLHIDAYGIRNYSGKITANIITGAGTGEAVVSNDFANSMVAIVGISNASGTIEAPTVKGTAITTKIEGLSRPPSMARSSGIDNTGGTITADTVTGTGDSNQMAPASGIYNWNGSITATTSVIGTLEGSGSGGIANPNGTIIAPIVTGMGGDAGILSQGMIKAETVTGIGEYNGISGCTITAKTVIGTATGTSENANGIVIYDNRLITAETVMGTSPNGHGITIGRGTKITATVSVTGKGGKNGILLTDSANSGVTITTETVTGITTGANILDNGVCNYGGIINATTIVGTSEYCGIENSAKGIIEANTITGTGTTYGINNNNGTIKTETITGTATNTNGIGVRNNASAATITATVAITGTATSGTGIHNNIGKITAPTLYYCPDTSNTGTMTGTRVCKSGCTCTN